jgi:N-acetylmuramoyl-L-alanine amidase
MPTAPNRPHVFTHLPIRTLTAISAALTALTVSMAAAPGPTAEAAPPPPSRSVAPGPPPGQWMAMPTTRVLVWGDTLWQLAQTYGVTVAALQAANGLGASTTIYAGTTLNIPGRYLVTAATTLNELADALGVPAASLAALNPGVTTLAPGTTVVVPPTSADGPVEALGAFEGVSAQDLAYLAHLVQAEAGNQPFLGMVAVAAVVLNRTRAPGFPHTIAGVIFAPGQFESVQNGTFWQAPSQVAYQAAEAAISGEDPSDGALFFYNPALTTNTWIEGLPVVARIGQQVFSR